MLQDKQFRDGMYWVNIDSERLHEAETLYEKYGIDEEIIAYALDKNERAHMDYDRETRTVLFVYNVLDLDAQNGENRTVPMTFVVQSERLITISNSENAYVLELMKNYLEKQEDLVSVYTFLFASLELISKTYYSAIEKLDHTKNELNALLRKKTTKKNLYALSDLELSIIYLAEAAKQNGMLLDHIKGHLVYRNLDVVEQEQFEDAMIEAHQLVAMTELISLVLQNVSESYNTIINNTINDNLTNLTIISILLAVIAVITGFFGMNVPLPLTEDKNAWIYICFGSILLWIIVAQFLKWVAIGAWDKIILSHKKS
ncbi:magnesium transporter CorA family protein [Streptococcus massiliensis]|uniref:CorA-like magnesium transporter n=2 Tax=Streptococcus massiliensis TaxID=313439 RepID=A0A380KYX2_9STRE|nr:magnesium transporter CorA family protein [Streptococcus massiliensis]SUN76918.1 CorA-like magnesium transporter [Streptococcus massiliensis]